MIEQLGLDALPPLAYEEIEHTVKIMLRRYPRLEGMIKIRERQALGKGIDFTFDVDTSNPIYQEDKLQALHARLRNLPEEKYLSKREQELVTIARENLDRYRQGTRSQLYDVKDAAYYSATEETQEALRTVVKKVYRVIDARGGYENLSPDDKAVIRADARRKAEREAQDLRNEKDTIEEAMNSLKSYAPHLELLLRYRYIEDRSVVETIELLHMAEKTYDRRKREAVCEFALHVGIT